MNYREKASKDDIEPIEARIIDLVWMMIRPIAGFSQV